MEKGVFEINEFDDETNLGFEHMPLEKDLQAASHFASHSLSNSKSKLERDMRGLVSSIHSHENVEVKVTAMKI